MRSSRPRIGASRASTTRTSPATTRRSACRPSMPPGTSSGTPMRDAGTTATGRSEPTPRTPRDEGRQPRREPPRRRDRRGRRVQRRLEIDRRNLARQSKSRATGPRVDRRWAAVTRPRCTSPMGWVPPVHRQGFPRAAFSTSVATLVGRSGRSAVAISSTSSGSTGRRSVASTETRSTASCDGPVDDARRPMRRAIDEVSSAGARASARIRPGSAPRSGRSSSPGRAT